jgi:hypothetical protein
MQFTLKKRKNTFLQKTLWALVGPEWNELPKSPTFSCKMKGCESLEMIFSSKAKVN